METVETLVFAENGFPIEDRLGKVKEALEPIFNDLNEKYLADYEYKTSRGAKKVVLQTISPFTMRSLVYKALAQFKHIDNSIANEATEEQILRVYDDFLDFIAWLNEYCPFAPTKQLFCNFSGISETAYLYLMTDGDEEQKSAILRVESYLQDMLMDSSAQGISKERTTEFRMRTKGIYGHNARTTTAVDDIVDNAKDVMSQADYNRMLVGIVEKDLIEASKG
jgi:hypothetical protein